MDVPWISICTFLPLLTAAVICLIPSDKKSLIKWVALLGASLTFLFSLNLWFDFGKEENVRYAVWAKAEADEILARQDLTDRSGFIGTGSRLDQESLTPLEQQEFQANLAKYLDNREFREWRELTLASRVEASEHIRSIEYAHWIPAFGIHYFMGIDGISLPLFLLTSLLGVICIAYSWNIDKATKGYMALFLMLETGLLGVFCALDFFLFYVFWEVVLLPMYFLIGIWGGPRRIYAAIKFFIYTLVGSVLMLIAMLALYFETTPSTFNMLTLMHEIPAAADIFQYWVFAGLFIGFVIKVPSVPFHTWLPDAHVQAPTAVSVVLAGVLLKMGGYGLFRVAWPMLPEAATHPTTVTIVLILALASMLYGALCAMAQKDFKSLVAYSSISHMGYVLLGLTALTAAGAQGAAFQMITHGISSAMLFLLVGVIYERAHHRDLGGFGGIGLQMPQYTGMAMVGFFASLGLPGLCGFISEALVFLGAYQAQTFGKGVVFIAVPTVVLTAAYILWTIQRVFLGSIRNEKYKEFKDLNFREWFALAPLAILAIVLGVWPRLVLDVMDGSLTAVVNMVSQVFPG